MCIAAVRLNCRQPKYLDSPSERKPLRAWFHGVAVTTFTQSLIAGRNFPSTESVGTLDDRNPHSNMFALSPRPAQSSPIQGQQTLSL
ncbi:hypothetical protein HYQ44_014962 [Verticillium longisporum]|nr:hypothetical protein HYQ44_014962 [Verticillium longisporum]